MVKWVALALMLYPYVVWGTAPVWGVGIVLCALAWWCWLQPATTDSNKNTDATKDTGTL
jgi:hypothetical protein